MHVFFEEDGGFKVGSILEATGTPEPTSYQVELPTGRRAKIKASNVVYKFAQPAPADLMRDAQALAETIDLAFLWEVSSDEEFEAVALGADYFGHAPDAVQTAALLLGMHGAPMYFRRKGKGRYKRAPEAELKAALAGQERRQQQAAQQAAMVEALCAHHLPAGWEAPAGATGAPSRAAFIGFRPDKNSLEYKALEQAAQRLGRAPVRVLHEAGAFADPKALHRARFLVEWFPRGTGFDPALQAPAIAADALPLADVQAFSIDDSQTTEIDDAFSVTEPGAGRVRVGIHIAAPGLAFAPGDALDQVARKRLSTVYMPGEKITMLPDAVVEAYTLGAGQPRPALSLYAEFDPDSGVCLGTETRIERVPMAANLRHDQLDAIVTEASLGDPQADFAFKRELQTLWRLTERLSAQREQVRGKPEPRNRADYAFRIESVDGGERVRIEQRRRDAPLDRIVAEWMIFANSTWGRLLADAGLPGIYRTQTQFARPGARQSSVRMTTAPAAHIGLGVTHYAWSSSPLRRYVDLVNQWQLIAAVRRRDDPGWRPPFEKNSAELFAIIGAFDAAYAAYAEVQGNLERYWSLRWLAQEGLVGSGRSLPAVVLRNEAVRLSDVPIAARLAGIAHLAPGTHVEVDVLAIDELDLTLEMRLAAVHAEAAVEDVETLDEPDAGPDGAPADDAGEADAAATAAPEARPATDEGAVGNTPQAPEDAARDGTASQ